MCVFGGAVGGMSGVVSGVWLVGVAGSEEDEHEDEGSWGWGCRLKWE